MFLVCFKICVILQISITRRDKGIAKLWVKKWNSRACSSYIYKFSNTVSVSGGLLGAEADGKA